MLAHGHNCSEWDDSVDWAALELFDFEETSDANFVLTTWHADDTVDEVFSFAKTWARHPVHALNHTIIFHISPVNQRDKVLEKYHCA